MKIESNNNGGASAPSQRKENKMTLKQLLTEEKVLWEYLGKEQIGNEMNDEQWERFLKKYQDKFADAAYQVAKDCVVEFMEHEDIKWI